MQRRQNCSHTRVCDHNAGLGEATFEFRRFEEVPPANVRWGDGSITDLGEDILPAFVVRPFIDQMNQPIERKFCSNGDKDHGIK